MCSEPVVSQHNDLKGMLVPGYSMVPSVQSYSESGGRHIWPDGGVGFRLIRIS